MRTSSVTSQSVSSIHTVLVHLILTGMDMVTVNLNLAKNQIKMTERQAKGETYLFRRHRLWHAVYCQSKNRFLQHDAINNSVTTFILFNNYNFWPATNRPMS